MRKPLSERRERKMSRIDGLPQPLRDCVHEFGWRIVKAFLEAGVIDARDIRILVKTIRHEDKPAWLRGPWNDPDRDQPHS